MEMKPRNLTEVVQEVENIRDLKGQPVDDQIKDLVVGLRRWGITTEMSCEGHLSNWPFPWICVSSKDVEGLNKIRILILSWRNPLKSPWVFVPFGGFWRMQPKNLNQRLLRKHQEEAVDFGKFLRELEEIPEYLLS